MFYTSSKSASFQRRSHPRTAAFLAWLLACLLSGTALGQNSMAPPDATMSEDEWTTSLQALAMTHGGDLNPARRFEPPLLEAAVSRLEAGVAPEQIADDTRRGRGLLQQVCPYASIWAGAVGVIACSPSTIGSAICGGAAATLALYVCNDAWRRSNYSPGVRLTTEELLRRVKEIQGGEQLWNDVFAQHNGFPLHIPPDELLESNRTLVEALSEHGIDIESAPNDQIALPEAVVELQEKSMEVLGGVRDGIELRLDSMETATSEPWVHAAKAEQAKRDRVDMANARVAVGAAAALIGLADPEAGSHISVVGDAVFGVYGAVKAFGLADHLGANTDLASLALSANLIGVALTLFGSFVDTGPSADEVIIEEIGKLREQVQELRSEMHARFDGVHEHLARVMDRLDEGFGLLSNQNARIQEQLRSVSGQLRQLGSQIDGIAHGLSYTYLNLTAQHDALMEAVVGSTTRGCTGPRLETPVGFLDDCVYHFDTLANLLKADQTVPGPSDRMLEVDLAVHPDRTTNASLAEFRRMRAAAGLPSDGLPAEVVGPEAWFELMGRHDEFRERHAGDVSQGPRPNIVSDFFAGTMRAHRDALRRYVDAIADDLRVVTGIAESRETVFSTWFTEARNRLSRLTDLIRSNQDAYHGDPSLFGGRTRPFGDGGAVIPEVGYRDPYAWSPMAHFYSRERLPEWLRYLPYRECGRPRAIRRRVRPGENVTSITWWSPPQARAWFQGDGVLRFVHANDVMPARLGMGTVEVCVTAGGEALGDAQRLAVRIVFVASTEAGGEVCTPQRALLSNTVAGASLTSMMLDVASRVDLLDAPKLIDPEREIAACQDLYEERFDERRRAFSDHLRRSLLEDSAFREVALQMRVANAHLRSWLTLALDDARWRSDKVEALLSVDAAPDLERVLREGDGYAWEVMDLAGARIDNLEEILQSGWLRDAVLYGAGHRMLTGAYFQSLD